MQFVYMPEGVEPDEAQRWDFDPDRLLSPEAEAIERHCRMPYAEWQKALNAGSMLALHGLLYVLLKRSNPTLKWDQVVFSAAEVGFELSDDEARSALLGLRLRQAAGEELTDDELAVAQGLADRYPDPEPDADDTDDGDDGDADDAGETPDPS